MIVGTHVDGRPLSYDAVNGTFALGAAIVSADQVRAYHTLGQLEWQSPETGNWFEASFPQGPREAPAAPVTATRSKTKTGLVVGLLIGALLLCGVGGVVAVWYTRTQKAASAADAAAAKAEADKAIEAVGKINAAVGVGVNYQNYGPLLNEAAAGVEVFQPEDATGSQIRADLARAVLYYQAGREAWYADIQDEVVDVASWRVQYPEVHFSSDEGDKVLGDTARQAAWVIAGAAYDQAKQVAAAYDK